MIDTLPLWAIVLALIVTLLAAVEAGYRIGIRRRRGGPDSQGKVGEFVLTSVLGLLALLLGFAFLLSIGHYDARRALVVEEANAIGTAILRAQVLDEEDRAYLLARLGDYVTARIAFFEAGNDRAGLDAAYGETGRLQGEIWARASAVARAAPQSQPASLVLQSLNTVFDIAAERRAAFEGKDPPAILYTLMAVAIAAAAMLGSAMARRADAPKVIVFVVLVAFVIGLIIDIDRPRRGMVLVSQTPMIELSQSLEKP